MRDSHSRRARVAVRARGARPRRERRAACSGGTSCGTPPSPRSAWPDGRSARSSAARSSSRRSSRGPGSAAACSHAVELRDVPARGRHRARGRARLHPRDDPHRLRRPPGRPAPSRAHASDGTATRAHARARAGRRAALAPGRGRLGRSSSCCWSSPPSRPCCSPRATRSRCTRWTPSARRRSATSSARTSRVATSSRRIVHGTRASLVIGLAATAIGIGLGLVLGLLARARAALARLRHDPLRRGALRLPRAAARPAVHRRSTARAS